MKKVMCILYQHPEYWRVSSVKFCPRCETLAETNRLKSEGFKINLVSNLTKGLDLFELGQALGKIQDYELKFLVEKQIIREVNS